MLTVAGATVAGLAALLARPWWQARQRAAMAGQPFPAAWRRILRQRVPAVARLPADLRGGQTVELGGSLRDELCALVGLNARGEELRIPAPKTS